MPVLSCLLFYMEGFVVLFLHPAENSLAVNAIVISLNATLLLAECVSRARVYGRVAARYVFVGIVFRMVLLVWDIGFRDVFTLPNTGDTFYADWAASGFETGDFGRGAMYSRIIAWGVYSIFGVQEPIAQYTNILMFALTLGIVLRSMDELDTSIEAKQKAVMFLCLLPNTAIMNVIFIRETLVAFLVAASVFLCIKWYKTGRWVWVAASFALSMAAATLHNGTLAVLVGEAVFIVLYDQKKDSLNLEPKTIAKALFVIVALLMLSVVFGDRLLNKLSGTESIDSVVEDSQTARGNSGYTVGIASSNNMLNFVVNTPLRMLYFVASPLPWMWRGLSDIIAFFFSALFYVQTYRSAFQVLTLEERTKHHSVILLLTVLALASAFMFGWGVRNAGTALRHREKFVVIYLLLYCVCKEDVAVNTTSQTLRSLQSAAGSNLRIS